DPIFRPCRDTVADATDFSDRLVAEPSVGGLGEFGKEPHKYRAGSLHAHFHLLWQLDVVTRHNGVAVRGGTQTATAARAYPLVSVLSTPRNSTSSTGFSRKAAAPSARASWRARRIEQMTTGIVCVSGWLVSRCKISHPSCSGSIKSRVCMQT